jgi:autotransporter-associated beta strand protein
LQQTVIGRLGIGGTGFPGPGALVNSASASSVLTPAGLNGGYTFLAGDTTIGVTQSGGSLTLNNEIDSGDGPPNPSITKVGLGTLTLTGPDTSTGPINVNAGTLVINGGSVAGDVVNAATFIYYGIGFGGRLTNTGTAIFNADFAPGNGMENAGTASANFANLTLGGAGLNNTGDLSMSGGTLTLSNAMNANSGTISLAGTARLNLTGATLTNSGMLSLEGCLVSGSGGTLTNAAGGDIFGTGVIQCAFTNSCGLLSVGNGAINVTQAFSNSGIVELTAAASALTGGAITNTGTLQGLGNVSNAVTNGTGGTLEAMGGTLVVGGALQNQSGGLVAVDSASKLVVSGGLATNAGIINLTGGTFDNNGHPLNNASSGQISGWGIFRTGGSGLDNNGSITFSGGLTTVNGPVTNENGKTITVAYNPAIFTGLVTNAGTGTFNVLNTTVVFAGGSSGNVPGAFANAGGAAFSESGSGVIEVDGPPSLGNSSSIAVGQGSTLRFKATSGAAAIGTGVTATVASGGTLELAGSVSALSSGSNRVDIINNSSWAGLFVSGTHQQVGTVDGSGTTQVNAGSDLTANHIIQSALVIAGTAGSHGLVTIDASDSSGNPLGDAADSGLWSEDVAVTPLGRADGFASDGFGGDLFAPTAGAPGGGNLSAIPEPTALVLASCGIVVLLAGHISATCCRPRGHSRP